MSYTKTEWKSKNIINADSMNNIENGIEALDNKTQEVLEVVDESRNSMLNTIKSTRIPDESNLIDIASLLEVLRGELYTNVKSKFVYPEKDDGLERLIELVKEILIDGSAGPRGKVSDVIKIKDLEYAAATIRETIKSKLMVDATARVTNTITQKELAKEFDIKSEVTDVFIIREGIPPGYGLSDMQIEHYNRLKSESSVNDKYFFRIATVDDVQYLVATKVIDSLKIRNRIDSGVASKDKVFYASDKSPLEYYDDDDPSANLTTWPNCFPYNIDKTLSNISEMFI